MEIKKGYTLSQFVDYLSELKHSDKKQLLLNRQQESYTNEILVLHLDAIETYNDFLKQPLKKEQFINEIEKPKGNPPFEEGIDHHNYIKWVAAEKKVIFKNVKKTSTYGFKLNGRVIEIYENGNIYYDQQLLTNLGDLFQATNSELETQNIEL